MTPDTDPLRPTDTVTPAPATAERWLAAACLAAAAALAAVWLPNYLRWPLYLDSEHFAQLAREWDAGIARPYRDSVSYNWPGQIYLFWAGGKVFGWGKSLAVQGVDAAVLLAGLAGLVAWSRRCYGRALPGALAALAVTGFYLNCDFRFTAERPWHAAWFAAGSVMAAQAATGAAGVSASGVLFALAVLVRPDIGVWALGALVALAGLPAPAEAEDGRSRAARVARAWAAWGASAAAGLAAGMAPLVWQGLFGDFVRAFAGAARGAFYDREAAAGQTAAAILRWLPYYECFQGYGRTATLGGLAALWAAAAWRGRGAPRRHMLTWLGLAAASAAVALNVPYYIGYLVLPVVLAALVSVAPAVACLADDLRRAPGAAVAVVGLLAATLLPGLPAYCDPHVARASYAAILARRPVAVAPVYNRAAQEKTDLQASWDDYRRCVEFLRHGLPRGVAVANAVDPFGDLGGVSFVYASGRRAAGGDNVLLVPSVPDGQFERMLASLAAAPDSAVVTTATAPGPHARKLGRWHARLDTLLRERYAPASRFGPLEVWVRTPEGRVADRPDPGTRR